MIRNSGRYTVKTAVQRLRHATHNAKMEKMGRAETVRATAAQLRQRYDLARYDFIVAELDVGFTYCELANSTHNAEKFKRNREHAEVVYDAARHYLVDAPLSDDMKRMIQGKMELLESFLRDLRA